MSVPDKLPPGLAFRCRTPSFTAASVAEALTQDHSTKDGVWGLIHVESGKLQHTVCTEGHEESLTAGDTAVVPPEVLHHIKPAGDISFYAELRD